MLTGAAALKPRGMLLQRRSIAEINTDAHISFYSAIPLSCRVFPARQRSRINSFQQFTVDVCERVLLQLLQETSFH